MADFVLTSYINNRQETNCNLKRKADVFEAFVGALYLDQGLEAVSVFCSVCMFNKLQVNKNKKNFPFKINSFIFFLKLGHNIISILE